MGEVHASHLTTFSSLVEVVSGALGGSKKSSRPPTRDNVDIDLTQLSTEEYIARFNGMMSGAF